MAHLELVCWIIENRLCIASVHPAAIVCDNFHGRSGQPWRSQADFSSS